MNVKFATVLVLNMLCYASAFATNTNPRSSSFIGISSSDRPTYFERTREIEEAFRKKITTNTAKGFGAGLTLSTALWAITSAKGSARKSLALQSAAPTELEEPNGVVAVAPVVPTQVEQGGAVAAAPATKKGLGIDFGLLAYFALWYLGNYYYNVTNKLALKAAGGKTGFPMMISGLQLGVGSIYALFMWLAPDARQKPKITMNDLMLMLPVAICFVGAHSASVFAMGLGAVSFAQIVKAAEPAFAAVLSQFVYGKKVSVAKWACLPVVIGGVILASVKELDFAWAALASACIANLFAAIKGNENKKLMETPGLKDRLGSVGNQFAVTTLFGFLLSLPLMLLKEGSRLGEFMQLCKTTPAIWINLVASGLYFYLYNELATMTLKKTGAVTQSVANTAKRVIVIVGVALVLGESLSPMKLIGCSIGIGGVFLYSVIDKLVQSKV